MNTESVTKLNMIIVILSHNRMQCLVDSKRLVYFSECYASGNSCKFFHKIIIK